ncbi:unnamed protein product [[Candida] boidinii]|uniref:Inositol hexakisphosphate and diphosphoinositol-pentakisphosphate kinase n=1 Tax=Candida boidinii TaxID=5477 RepID=A0A9W6W8F5_CANBO|nr:unnamed protein product [[Candida] boidinii]
MNINTDIKKSIDLNNNNNNNNKNTNNSISSHSISSSIDSDLSMSAEEDTNNNKDLDSRLRNNSISSERSNKSIKSNKSNSSFQSIPLTKETLEKHKNAIASIAPMLEEFAPVLSKSEIVSPVGYPVSRTVSNISNLSISDPNNPNNSNQQQQQFQPQSQPQSLSQSQSHSHSPNITLPALTGEDEEDEEEIRKQLDKVKLKKENSFDSNKGLFTMTSSSSNTVPFPTGESRSDSITSDPSNAADAADAPKTPNLKPENSISNSNSNSNTPVIPIPKTAIANLPTTFSEGNSPTPSPSATQSFLNSASSSSSNILGHYTKQRVLSVTEYSGPSLPKIGTIGVCAMDNKVLSKPCRQILNRLIKNGEFDTVIFGDKVILDESIENWPTCDFLISFFSNGFPLDKAIAYQKLRKPYLLNDLIMQKALWDRRLCLQILQACGAPTADRLIISRDGGPLLDDDLKKKFEELNINTDEVPEPDWEMLDEDTLRVEEKIIKKPFVEKPVDGEDHNIYIYYAKESGGGGRRLFRKIGNKSSEFDANLNNIRTNGSYIYEKFIDSDNFEDVKAYTVGSTFCHAETRKSPVVDGIVKRNTHGKEVRYITELTAEEKEIAAKVCTTFQQTICGFDLLRTHGKSIVIDVNGFSFVKDNNEYYDKTASIIRAKFIEAKKARDLLVLGNGGPTQKSEEKKQKWVFKGLVSVVRHADRTPKQKFKYSFKSPIFISLLKGYKEEIIIREVRDLKIVLEAVKVAQEKNLEDPVKLNQLATALTKKMDFPGTKVQIKPSLNKETNEIEKVQLIIKWGGEPTHSAVYQATDVGEQLRQDLQLLNKNALKDVQVFTSSERRVVASAQLFSKAFLDEQNLPEDFLQVRKDLLDDSNAAKDLMDKVKKKLKPLLRQGKDAPPQFAWPPKMPEPFIVIKRVVELMNYHKEIMCKNFQDKDVSKFQENWCCHEDPSLFKERWDKLFQEFVSVEKVHPSKISELYDTMKYDALHNREFLQKIFISDDNDDSNLKKMDKLGRSLIKQYPVNILAMNNFKFSDSSPGTGSPQSIHNNSIILDGTNNSPQSPGSNPAGSIGWVLSSSYVPTHKDDNDSPFDDPKFDLLRELYRLAKVLFDFICPQEYGIEDNEKLDIGLLTSLPLSKQIISDLSRIRDTDKGATVVYFTKESHIYTLLNVIYESKLPMKIPRNALPELDYLSQIMLN